MKVKRILISDVEIGNKIKSFNLITNEVEYREVLDTMKVVVRYQDQVKIEIDGAYIITSNWHPFPVLKDGSLKYIRSDEVLVGDITVDEDGNHTLVTAIDNDPREPEDFRDLTVDGNNNYFCSTHKDSKLHLIHNSRAGAATVALDVWHIDTQEFLELQTENGDQRRKAYDIFPQVVVSDEFMRRVEAGQPWTLMDPYEVKSIYGVDLSELWGSKFTGAYNLIESDGKLKTTKVVNAKDLFKQIMKSQIETGMPYIFFKDTVNKYNPNKGTGYIPCGNLCQESYSNVKPSESLFHALPHSGNNTVDETARNTGETHICNLVSVNLAILDPKDEVAISDTQACSVRILDNAIDITFPPTADSRNHNTAYRIIGVGYMGFHDMVAKLNMRYVDSVSFTEELFEKFAFYGYKASSQLAAERGCYGKYDDSEYKKGLILDKDESWFVENSKMGIEWSEVFEMIAENGMRNGQIMAIAPNTSTSQLMGCTASVLPTYSKFHIDKNSKGSVPVFPPYIKDSFWYYTENKNTDQNDVVKVVSTMQKWVDTGISLEVVYDLNKGLTAKDIYDVLINAWKSGCKAIYYTRTIQNNVESTKEDCVSCAN